MPNQVSSSSSCNRISTAFSWKVSVEEWSTMSEDSFLPLLFRICLPPDGRRVDCMLQLYTAYTAKEDIEVFLSIADEMFVEDDQHKLQFETAFRIRKPGATSPLDMYNSVHYETYHSSEFEFDFEFVSRRVMNIRRIEHTYDAGKVLEWAENGFLTVEFEIRTYSSPIKKFQSSVSRQNQTFINHFEDLLSIVGDVKVICDDQEFTCHKLLLTSQSPVFKAMFAQDSKENAENKVNIEDSTPEAVKEFLFYVCHARMRHSVFTSADLELVLDLVHLSSKYQVELLMDSCKDIIVDIIDTDNVLKIMTVVYKYPELRLMSDMIINFMKKNITVIMQNEDWIKFVVTSPSLVTELITHMNKKTQ